MILRLLLAIMVIGFLLYGFSHFRRQPKEQQKKLALKAGIILLVGGLLLMVVTGRLHWLGAIAAGLIPVVRRLFPWLIRSLPLLNHLYKQRQAGNMKSGNQSKVQTDYLLLTLDHDTGNIEGEIISGLFQGKTLTALSDDEARQLLRFYRERDGDSFNLLATFLQRTRGESTFEQASSDTDRSGHEMTRLEALQVLGLEETATEEDILAAHKKLMQKLHPDRGGSNYLAARVNEAKDFLLK